MKRTIIVALAALVLLPVPADAGLFKKKKKKAPAATEAPKPAPKKEKRPAPVEGLFNVQHFKEDWFFQIPDSLLGRPFLSTTRFISTPVNLGV